MREKRSTKDSQVLKKYELSKTTIDDITTKNGDMLFIGTTCQSGTEGGILHIINQVNFMVTLQKKWYNCTWTCANRTIARGHVQIIQFKKKYGNPIISNDMNSHCQDDLIDMQSQSDGDCRFIMNYEDHLTKVG